MAAVNGDTSDEFQVLERVSISLCDAMISCDLKGYIRVCNPAALNLFGISKSNRLNMCSELYGMRRSGEEQPVHPSELPLTRALSGQEVLDEHFEIDQSNGTVVRVIVLARPLIGLGAVLVCRRL